MTGPIPTTVPEMIEHLLRWAEEWASHDGIAWADLQCELLRIAAESGASLSCDQWGRSASMHDPVTFADPGAGSP